MNFIVTGLFRIKMDGARYHRAGVMFRFHNHAFLVCAITS